MKCEKCKVKDPEDKRRWIKTELHYKCFQGMRVYVIDENGNKYYNVYCPKCEEYFKVRR